MGSVPAKVSQKVNINENEKYHYSEQHTVLWESVGANSSTCDKAVPILVEIRNHGAQAPKALSQSVLPYSNAYFACS